MAGWNDNSCKARSDEMRKARSRKCRIVLHQSRSRISERGKSLRCWRASRHLSSLSCRLPYICWAVNRLLYLWTRSPSSSILPVLDFQHPRDAMALGQANYFASRFACGRAVLIYYSSLLPANAIHTWHVIAWKLERQQASEEAGADAKQFAWPNRERNKNDTTAERRLWVISGNASRFTSFLENAAGFTMHGWLEGSSWKLICSVLATYHGRESQRVTIEQEQSSAWTAYYYWPDLLDVLLLELT